MASRLQHRVARQSAELALAVPQVMAHRLTRMALAGHSPSARDRREFSGMVAEKPLAFAQAAMAMGWQTAVAQQAFLMNLMRWAFTPWQATPAALAAQMQSAAFSIAGKGLQPLHRKATGNARRLAKTRLL